jgi:Fe-Mn family superoxide dismutase
MFKLPELPYSLDALAPYISEETLKYHYGKHHRGYVEKLNTLVSDSTEPKSAMMTLEEIILHSEGPIFNNAAQVWNHTFFWNCLTPKGKGRPSPKVSELINKTWGSFEKFQDAFSKEAVSNFGSGWTWLNIGSNNQLTIKNTSNAMNPIRENLNALLTVDVWEHAYYLDYHNDRSEFIKAFWKIVNWDFVDKQLEKFSNSK